MKKGTKMQIRAYIKPGPHITHVERLGFRAFGATVLDEGTDPSIMLPESVIYTGHIPNELKAVIRHYSVHDQYPEHRTRGMYQLAGAEAVVKSVGGGYHKTEAHGKVLADAVRLCALIHAGDIVPDISHEGEQVKSPVLGIKEAAHRLIDAIALAFGQWRLRIIK